MPEIDLDILVPEDITFKFRGKKYAISGDISSDATFKLIEFIQRFAALQSAPKQDMAKIKKLNDEIQTDLLALFQERDPSVKSLPFGQLAYAHVLREVLKAVGLEIEMQDPTPPEPTPNRATRRLSTRSNGPSPSAKRSGSGRNGGKGSRS